MFYAPENKRWVSLIRGEVACDLYATSTAGCIVVQANLTDMHMLRPPLRIKEFLLGARCGDATVTNAVYIALRPFPTDGFQVGEFGGPTEEGAFRSSRHSASIVARGSTVALSCGAEIVVQNCGVRGGVAEGAEEKTFQNFVPQGIQGQGRPRLALRIKLHPTMKCPAPTGPSHIESCPPVCLLVDNLSLVCTYSYHNCSGPCLQGSSSTVPACLPWDPQYLLCPF